MFNRHLHTCSESKKTYKYEKCRATCVIFSIFSVDIYPSQRLESDRDQTTQVDNPPSVVSHSRDLTMEHSNGNDSPRNSWKQTYWENPQQMPCLHPSAHIYKTQMKENRKITIKPIFLLKDISLLNHNFHKFQSCWCDTYTCDRESELTIKTSESYLPCFPHRWELHVSMKTVRFLT